MSNADLSSKKHIGSSKVPSQDSHSDLHQNSEGLAHPTHSLINRLQRTIGNHQTQQALNIQHHAPSNLISRDDNAELAAAREQAKKFDPLRVIADDAKSTPEKLNEALVTLASLMHTIQTHLDNTRQESWKKQIRVIQGTGTSLKERLDNAIKLRKADTDNAKIVTDQLKSVTKKYGKVTVSGAAAGLNKIIKTLRDALGTIAGASTEDVIRNTVASTTEPVNKALVSFTTIEEYVTQAQGIYNTANNAFVNITNLTDARDQALIALSGISDTVKVLTEAKTIVTALRPFFDRALGHVTTLSEAKLNALAKAKEAKESRAKADDLKKQLEEAKAAEQKFKEALDKVKSDTSKLEEAKSTAEKLVTAMKEELVNKQNSLQTFLKQAADGDAEPYMVEGYTKGYYEAIDAAKQAVDNAVKELEIATANLQQGMLTLETAQSDLDKASNTTSQLTQTAQESETAANEAELASTTASQTATEQTDIAVEGNKSDVAAQEELRALRDAVGSQSALNELLGFIPDKKEAKTLIDDLTYSFLIECLKDTDIGIDKVRPFHATYKTTYLADCDKARIKRILKTFTITKFADLHSKVDYGKIKEWIASTEVDNLCGYVDQFTPAHFAVWQAQLSAQQMIDLIKKITIEKLKLVAASYTATEFKPYVDDFTMEQLDDLLTGFKPADLKVYVNTLTYAKLQTMLNTHKLKSNALIKYEAAWLKDFVGVGPNTMAHLTNIFINYNSAQISGGHDKDVFTNYINGNHGPGQRRGKIDTNDNGDPISHVQYTLYNPNGTVLTTTGFKTLIKGLAADVPTWQAKMNTVLWASIKNLLFNKAGGARLDTGGYGFYYNGGTEVDTAFPL